MSDKLYSAYSGDKIMDLENPNTASALQTAVGGGSGSGDVEVYETDTTTGGLNTNYATLKANFDAGKLSIVKTVIETTNANAYIIGCLTYLAEDKNNNLYVASFITSGQSVATMPFTATNAEDNMTAANTASGENPKIS